MAAAVIDAAVPLGYERSIYPQLLPLPVGRDVPTGAITLASNVHELESEPPNRTRTCNISLNHICCRHQQSIRERQSQRLRSPFI